MQRNSRNSKNRDANKPSHNTNPANEVETALDKVADNQGNEMTDKLVRKYIDNPASRIKLYVLYILFSLTIVVLLMYSIESKAEPMPPTDVVVVTDDTVPDLTPSDEAPASEEIKPGFLDRLGGAWNVMAGEADATLKQLQDREAALVDRESQLVERAKLLDEYAMLLDNRRKEFTGLLSKFRGLTEAYVQETKVSNQKFSQGIDSVMGVAKTMPDVNGPMAAVLKQTAD